MRQITLSEKDIHKGYLLLVNKDHPLKHFPEESSPYLRSVDPEQANIMLELKTATLLSQLTLAAGCQGEIALVSGYRSRQEQTDIYQHSLIENGYTFTSHYVALPDCSEHQTGLAIDLSERKEAIDFICPAFPYDGICGEFRKKAAAYGFIERYEKDKEKITGIAWEPWHFRYIGYPHSMIMQDHHLSLEEYIDFIKNFQYPNNHYTFWLSNKIIEVGFVPYEKSKSSVYLPENTCYQISGNNVDGFIITIWR